MMDYETSVVVDCPVCKRTIWKNSTCYHGLTALTPEEEKKDQEKEEKPYDPREYEKKREGGDSQPA